MGARSRILTVDDNPRNLAILDRCLSREFTLVSASTGLDALEIAAAFRPDIILLDIMMPGIDGYETCRRLRKISQLAGTKIIMVSAKALTSERLAGYEAGADDYIIKPFEEDELIAKVRVYLRLKTVEEMNGLKSDLLDLLGRETTTPLMGIMGGIALLRDSTELTEDQLELLDVATASVERLQALVERVNLITQFKAGLVPAIREPVDLCALAAEVIAESQIDSKQKVNVVLDAAEPAAALGDSDRLFWVLQVLLDNALRFTPTGGTVTVTVDGAGPQPRVSVSDQGPGIAPGILPRIFEEFIVADVLHRRNGSGLSLAAAHRIADHNDAALTVRSEPGRKTEFTLQFPGAVAAMAA